MSLCFVSVSAVSSCSFVLFSESTYSISPSFFRLLHKNIPFHCLNQSVSAAPINLTHSHTRFLSPSPLLQSLLIMHAAIKFKFLNTPVKSERTLFLPPSCCTPAPNCPLRLTTVALETVTSWRHMRYRGSKETAERERACDPTTGTRSLKCIYNDRGVA